MTGRIVSGQEYASLFDQISDDESLSQITKLKMMFDRVTADCISQAEREIELLQAMGADEQLVNERIKAGTMRAARDIFAFCYRSLTGDRGRSIWSE